MKTKATINAIIILVILTSISLANMTKMYLGNEDGQVIVGIESFASNQDAGVGMEIRTYFRRAGIVVHGTEYGAKPNRTKYTFTAAGVNEEGTIGRFHRNITYTMNEGMFYYDVDSYNTFEIGYGKGPNLAYH